MNYKIQFRTSYSQFYIADKDSPGNTDSSRFWTEQAFADKLAMEDGILGIGIETYSFVKTEITVLTQRTVRTNLEEYDQVVEGSLEVKSGVIHVLDCPNSAVILQITVLPGFYRVRVNIFGLESIHDEDKEANDSYLIEIWPESPSPKEVLKCYPKPY